MTLIRWILAGIVATSAERAALGQTDAPASQPPAAPAAAPAETPAEAPAEEPAKADEGFSLDITRPLTRTIISGEELHRWDRYVRGFRREHNFALSSGISSGTWIVRRFGTLADDEGERRFDSSGIFTRFQYSFHLPLYEGFGFFLGSSAGYHYESADKRQDFKPVSAYMFPGALAGLVLNFNPVLRWQIGLEAYLERHNGIEDRDGEEPDPEIYVTFQTYDFSTMLDVFYDLNWALRIEVHRRHLEMQRPKPSSNDETFPVEANIKKDDQWLGLGLVYHLL